MNGLRSTFTVSLLILFTNSFSQVNPVWVTRYASTGNKIDKAKAMTSDAKHTYVTGVSNGAANNDYITIKYRNSDGSVAPGWPKTHNGTGNGWDESSAIFVDANGNVYVTGWSLDNADEFDIATIKYDSTGNQLWVRYYNGPANGNDEGRDITVDASGNVYVTGSSLGTTGTVDNADYVTIKYNAGGTQQWATRFEHTVNGEDIANALFVDGSGNVYVTGASTSAAPAAMDIATIKYNSSGVQQWEARRNGPGNNDDFGNDVVADASGNVYITGSENALTGTNNNDYVTIKYNSSGVQQWIKQYDGSKGEYDVANKIILDASDNIYITGRVTNTGVAEDIATIKYNNGGTPLWTRIYDGEGRYDEGKDIQLDASGNVYITGLSNKAASNHDYITLKYNSSGTRQWVARYNGPDNDADQAVGVRIDGSGYVYVSGVSRGSGTSDDFATIKYCQFGIQATADANAAICQGGSVVLTVTGGVGAYTWTPATGLSSTTAGTVTANPTVTTTYIITGQSAAGCTDQDTVTVAVNPVPTASVAKSPTGAICQGDSVKITGTTNAASYTWSSGDTSLVIWKKTSGTYKLTVSNPTGCSSSAQVNVTVNPLPTLTVSASGPTTFCEGGSIMLSATSNSNYTWSTGVSNAPINVNSSGTYTITAKTGPGCTRTNSFLVTVHPLPNLSITPTGPTTFCKGGFVSLSANSSYPVLWNTGDSVDLITVDTSGTYIVTTRDGNNCENSDTITVFVGQFPSVTVTKSPASAICQGDSALITGTTNGASYTWSTGDTALSFWTKAAGTYKLTASNPPGCNSSAQAVVTVNAVPTLTVSAGGATTFCEGDSVLLSAVSNSNYSWNTGAFNTSVKATTSGTYIVTATNVFNCKRSGSVVVTVNSNPPKPVITVSLTPHRLISSSPVKNQWYRNDTLLTGDTTQTYILTLNGKYRVLVTNSEGCSTWSDSIQIIDVGIPKNDRNGQALNIYPNPSSGKFMVELLSETRGKIRLSLFTLTGQHVSTDEINTVHGLFRKEYDLGLLAPGIYFIRVATEEGVLFRKIEIRK